ncbi:Ig-like domain-containing protein, partial [Yoonia sp. 208BN28-4]|uniref:Ig-like domain-containing protein n=1 Tax=Yoonia sp. 208BN28-4 TaxID=3126505 RepID=UPI0030B20150
MTFKIDWDHIGSDGSQTLTQDGQSVQVSVSTPENAEHKQWFVENGMLKNWDVRTDSNADIRFDQEVENVKFTLLDVDNWDEITIMTKDADGNPVPVSFEVTGNHTVNGNTVVGDHNTSNGPGMDDGSQDIEVCIAGPLKTFWIVLDDGPGRDYSSTVAVSDITFDLPPQLDGYVNGNDDDNIIDAGYLDDPQGDKIDNNDEILPGEAAQDDVVLAEGGNDVVRSGAGDDEVYGGSGNDMLFTGGGDDLAYGGTGDDKIEASAGDDLVFGGDGNDDLWGGKNNDTVVGGLGNDTVNGGDGDDLVAGGKGDDNLVGGAGKDTVFGGADSDNIDGGSGDDTLIGGGISFNGTLDFNDLAAGDFVNGQYAANGVHIYSADPHNPVMIFDSANPTGGDHDLGSDTLGNILILSEDRDGSDPDDNASGGTFVFDFDGPATVESLDFKDIEGGAWIKLYDMNGNLIRQIDTAQTANQGELSQTIDTDGVVRMEVIINGSGAIDNLSYTLDGEALDTGDTIKGQDGDDVIDGQAGDDELFGGAGNDDIQGGAGNDLIEGGSGNDVLCGDEDEGSDGRVDELTLNWTSAAPVGTGLGAAQTYSVGGMDVSVSFNQQDDGAVAEIRDTDMYVEAGENFAANSGLYLYGLGGEGGVDNTSTTTLTFSSDDSAYGDEVQNVSFRINDIDNGTDADDHIDIVTVRAFDADGNAVAVTITPENGAQVVNGNTVTGGVEDSSGVTPASAAGSVLFEIAGPVARIEIDYDNGETTDQRVDVSDINFFTTAADTVSEGGDDTIFGGTGDDVIFGKVGDDLLSGDAGADTVFGGADADTILGGAGDVVDGGSEGDDNDVLDLTGQGEFILTGPDGTGDPIPDSNGNGIDGKVIFVDENGDPTGEEIDFVEIEQILGTPFNFGPDATDDGFGVGEDDGATPLGNVITGNNGNGADSDPENDPLTVTAVDGDPANVGQPVDLADGGTVTINADGSVSFDPDGDFEDLGEGEEATVSVTYTIADGQGGEDTATVTFTVTGTNDGPVATDNAYTVDQNEDAGDTDGNAITENTGAGEDSDVDDDQSDLAVSQVNGAAGNVGNVVAGDNGGLFTVNADGTIDFDANGEFDDLGAGDTASTSITYTITDPDGLEDTATVTFTINGTNDDPIACPDLYIVTEDETTGDVDGNVITNPSDNNAGLDIDPDGDTLTVVGVNAPDSGVGDVIAGDNGGTFVINPDGSFDFSANGEFEELAPGESAETSVTYTVSDGNGGTATTTLTIRVNGLNDGPVAVDDAGTTDEDADPADEILNVLGNDTDPEDDPLTVAEVNGDPAGVGTPVAGDNGGLITINPDGSTFFDPNGEFDDLDEGEEATTTVTYTVTDPSGETSTAMVTITVTGTNDAPTAVADTDATDQDTAIVLDNVLGNDEDPEDDPLTVSEVDGDPANVGQPVDGDNGGSFTINPDGTASFDPDGDFDDLGEGETQETTVTYTIVDDNGLTDTTTVTVTVTGTNDGPVAVADTGTTDEDT